MSSGISGTCLIVSIPQAMQDEWRYLKCSYDHENTSFHESDYNRLPQTVIPGQWDSILSLQMLKLSSAAHLLH